VYPLLYLPEVENNPILSSWRQFYQQTCIHCRTLALCEASREDVLLGLAQFLAPANPYQVLIISYETFRLHAQQFTKEGACDLLICDEVRADENEIHVYVYV
jgi:DNA repair and recombination RAD54-like protein